MGRGIPPPHSPPSRLAASNRRLILLLNCYPHFLDQIYAPADTPTFWTGVPCSESRHVTAPNKLYRNFYCHYYCYYYFRLPLGLCGVRAVSASTAATGTTVDCPATTTASAAAAPFVVRRWWNDCFVNNKLQWRERAVIGQLSRQLRELGCIWRGSRRGTGNTCVCVCVCP